MVTAPVQATRPPAMTLTVTAPVRAAGRLPRIAFDEVPPADRDVAVNGPLWDSHVISTVEQSTTEITDRRRVLAQASRRVKRSEEDHALIQDLRSQLEIAQDMVERKTNELAKRAQYMRRMQAVHRARRVQQVNQMAFRIRELEAGVTTFPLPDPSASCTPVAMTDPTDQGAPETAATSMKELIDRGGFDEDTSHRPSRTRRSRDHNGIDEDTSHRPSRSRNRDDLDRSGSHRSSGSKRARDSNDFDEDTSH